MPHIFSSPATPGTARPCAAPLAARSSSGISRLRPAVRASRPRLPGHRPRARGASHYGMQPHALPASAPASCSPSTRATPTDASKSEPRRSSTTASPCSISPIARLLPAPSLKTPRPSPSWETSPASCKSPSSTRRTWKRSSACSSGCWQPTTSPKPPTKRLAVKRPTANRKAASIPPRPIRQPPTRPLRPWPPI